MTKEEAIRRIKTWDLDSDDMEVLSTVIPELRESEDERIRKELLEEIEFIIPHDDETDSEGLILPSYHARIDRYKSYLEKQKEQKHSLNFDVISSWLKDHASNYVNGEFNEFHHCVDYDGTINVERLIADLKAAVDSGTFDVYEQKDQKSTENISQLTVQGKGVYKICPRCKERMVRDDSEVYTSMLPQYGYKCPKCGGIEFDTVMYDSPETEEQKPIEVKPRFKIGDTLKKKNKDYTFVVDKIQGGFYLTSDKHFFPIEEQDSWELLEQKPADIDLDTLVIELEETIGTSPHSRETIKDFFQRAVQKYMNCLRIASSRIGELIEENYHLKEQKQEWNEEDEEHLDSIIESYKELLKDYSANNGVDYIPYNTPVVARTVLNDIKFLKSLPERFNLQPRQEWSEEDKRALNDAIVAISMYANGQIPYILPSILLEDVERLKTLCPQPISQPNINHTVWHNASEEKPTKLPIIHIWHHGNRVNAVVAHEGISLQAELDDINFQPDDKWAYVEDLLNVQPHWRPTKEQMTALGECGECKRCIKELREQLKKL